MSEPLSLRKLELIAGLVHPVPSTMFVTSTDWGRVAKETQQHLGSAIPLRKGSFEMLLVGPLTVVNSGTEDQEVCNLLNRSYAEAANFAAKRDALRIG